MATIAGPQSRNFKRWAAIFSDTNCYIKMLRAYDKLEEAEFFFEKLKSTKNDETEAFRYYLSACISAMRSISLVLQKDLRSVYGAQFDKWWDEKKELVPTSPISFELIRDIRNILQKEGNRIEKIAKMKINNEVLENTEVRVELDTGNITISYEFPPDMRLEENRRKGETDEDFNKRVAFHVLRGFLDVDLGEELQGYSFSTNLPIITFESIETGFANYLLVIRGIIEEAQQVFGHQKSVEGS